MTTPLTDARPEIPDNLGQGTKATLSACADFDVEACCRYTRSRQTREGGFCFYAYPQWGVEEPNAPDTHAAVGIFRPLGLQTPDRERCAAWLIAQQDASGGFQTAVIAYAVLKALGLLGVQPRRCPRRYLRETAERLHIADRSPRNRDGWLVSALHCIELWKCFDIAVTAPMRKGVASALNRLQGGEGGFGVQPAGNLPETAAALKLSMEVGLPVGDEVLAYAQRCERAPLGFNSRHMRSAAAWKLSSSDCKCCVISGSSHNAPRRFATSLGPAKLPWEVSGERPERSPD